MSLQSYFLRVAKDDLGDYKACMKLGDMEFSTERRGEVRYMEYVFELMCEDGTATLRIRDPLRDNKVVNKHTTTSAVWQEFILWDKV